MSKEHTSEQKQQNFRILIHCPATGERVLGSNLMHFSVQEGKGAWWYCPKCEGWHVLVYEEREGTTKELYTPIMKQLHLNPA
jgi:hypothetical protein